MAWTRTLMLSLVLVACGTTHDVGDAGSDDASTSSDGGGLSCVPGESEAVACGLCGTETTTCGDDGVWAPGGCLGEGVCEPDATETVACGTCGTRTRTCSAGCAWDEGACEETGCTPGEVVYETDACPAGQVQARSCDATCTFIDVGGCEAIAPDPFIIVPYMGDPSPARLGMEFRTSVAFADIYFLFDRTGSMIDEIASLRTSVVSILESRGCADSGTTCASDGTCGVSEVCSAITGTCIESPALTSCVANLWSGVGAYDADYENVLELQGAPAMTETALSFSIGAGVEELNEALLAVAEPAGVASATGCTGPTVRDIGCPSFRPDARRIVIVFTDEDSDGTTSVMEAGAALGRAGITLVGIDSSRLGSTTRDSLVALARASGSLASDGVTPYVYPGSGSAVVPAVMTALDDVLAGGTQRVTIEVVDDVGDGADATAFVEAFEVDTTSAGCASGPTEDTDGDGLQDTFTAVVPGSRVCFDLIPRRNTSAMPDRTPLVYRVNVRVLGDGALLDVLTVHFVVPPVAP